MFWQFFLMPTLNPPIPACFQQLPIFVSSASLLSSYFLVCWMSLCLYDFSFINLLSWCQQHYSSRWRIPSGESVKTRIAILWNCSRNLSHFMLRVERGAKWRQTLIYWGIKVRVDVWWLMNSRQSFVRLLLIIFFVRFTISLHFSWHI